MLYIHRTGIERNHIYKRNNSHPNTRHTQTATLSFVVSVVDYLYCSVCLLWIYHFDNPFILKEDVFCHLLAQLVAKVRVSKTINMTSPYGNLKFSIPHIYVDLQHRNHQGYALQSLCYKHHYNKGSHKNKATVTGNNWNSLWDEVQQLFFYIPFDLQYDSELVVVFISSVIPHCLWNLENHLLQLWWSHFELHRALLTTWCMLWWRGRVRKNLNSVKYES